MKIQNLLALHLMDGVNTTMVILGQLQVMMKYIGISWESASLDYITSDWKRQALVLGCAPFDDRHNSSNIADWMTRELSDWKLTAATEMIVSDTAANQLGVFNVELVPDLPRHFKPAKCACHLLQLVINDCILLKPSIARIVKDCRFFLDLRQKRCIWVLGLSVLTQTCPPTSVLTFEKFNCS